jgi:hypothetical protein
MFSGDRTRDSWSQAVIYTVLNVICGVAPCDNFTVGLHVEMIINHLA